MPKHHRQLHQKQVALPKDYVKNQPQNKESRPPSKRKWLAQLIAILGKFFVVITSVLTIFTGVLYFVPSFSTNIPYQPDATNVGIPAFTLMNESIYPIHNVEFLCFYHNVEQPKIISRDNTMSATTLGETIIPSRQAMTIRCNPLFAKGNGTTYAEVSVLVSYSPWFFSFIRKDQEFRFVASFVNGKIYWLQQPPLSKKPRKIH